MLVSTRPFALALGRILTVLSVALFIPAFAALGRAHAESPPPQGVVNVNTAKPEELMLLPRIGEEKARRIVELRTRAPFKTVNDLARVKGIGLKTLRLLKPYVRIDGPTTLTSEVRGEEPEAVEVAPTPRPAPRATPGGTAPK